MSTPRPKPSTVIALAALATLLPQTARAGATPDELAFVLDLRGHAPATTPRLGDDVTHLASSELGGWVDELGLAYGIGTSGLASDLVLRVGLRRARATLPSGSLVGENEIDEARHDAYPVGLVWTTSFLPTRIRPLVGLAAGGSMARASVAGPSGGISSGWGWRWAASLLIGAEADLTRNWGLRVFAEARAEQRVELPDGAPAIGGSRVGAGLAFFARFGRPAKEELARGKLEDDRDALLANYDDGSRSRMDTAFAEIRAGDAAARTGDWVGSETHYARGVRLLPKDAATRRNVELPVRVDWARALVQLGQRKAAREVLVEALAIDPDHVAARELLGQLGYEVPAAR